MPLAGATRTTLLTSPELMTGVPAVRAVFDTPTQDFAFPMEGNLHALLPHAMSVWRIDGVWYEGFAPSADTVEAADRFYRGGYEHVIDEDEVVELTNAGYGDNITILEVLA